MRVSKASFLCLADMVSLVSRTSPATVPITLHDAGHRVCDSKCLLTIDHEYREAIKAESRLTEVFVAKVGSALAYSRAML